MRPIPLPSDVELTTNQTRKVIAAPNGSLIDDSIRPVEAVMEPVNLGTDEHPLIATQFAVCISLEDDDIIRLMETGRFYLCFLGHIVPFHFQKDL